MIDIIDATEVPPLGNYRLFVRFSDGTCGEHDFAGPLLDPATFGRVFVESGVPCPMDSVSMRSRSTARWKLLGGCTG
jgi:hypothetical protein